MWRTNCRSSGSLIGSSNGSISNSPWRYFRSVERSKRCLPSVISSKITQPSENMSIAAFDHQRYLHRYMLEFVSGAGLSPDQKVLKLRADFKGICEALSHRRGESPVDQRTNGFVIIGSLLVACIRSLAHSRAKLTALELLLALAQWLGDDHKLDWILPYVVFLLTDHLPTVRMAALRTITAIVGMVDVVRASDLSVFPEYILPSVRPLREDEEVLVRVSYAENIAMLATTAQGFAEKAMIAAMAEQQDSEPVLGTVGQSYNSDQELQLLRTIVIEDLVTLMTDPASVVKQSVLKSNIPALCAFLGPQQASDTLLCHMLTFLNDKQDWRLRVAFFDSIVPVATYCGSKSIEQFILTYFEKSMIDPEELVVNHTVDAMTACVELGLFQRPLLIELVRSTVALLIHPGGWVRHASVAFVCAVARSMSVVDLYCTLQPLVAPYLNRPVVDLKDEAVLIDALLEPLPRVLYDSAVQSFEALPHVFDALLQRKLTRQTGLEPTGPHGRTALAELERLGLTPDTENKLMLLEEYVSKVSRERMMLQRDVDTLPVASELDAIAVEDVGAKVHTVSIVIKEGEQVMPSMVPLGPGTHMIAANDIRTGAQLPFSFYRNDIDRLIANKRAALMAHGNTGVTSEREAGTVRGRKARKSAEARDRDIQRARNWRPSGILVGHLQEHAGAINTIAVSPDQRFFATGSDDGSIRLWDCGMLEGRSVTNRSQLQYAKQSGKITKVLVCEHKPLVVSASTAGSTHVVRVDYPERQFAPLIEKTMDMHYDGQVTDMQKMGGGQAVVVYSTTRGDIHGWDLRTDRKAWLLKGVPTHGLPKALLVDQSRSWVTVGTSRGVLAVWDLRYMIPVKSWLEPTENPVSALALFPSCGVVMPSHQQSDWDPESWVISASGVHDATVWDLATSDRVASFRGTELALSDAHVPVELRRGISPLSTTSVEHPFAVPRPRPAIALYEQMWCEQQALQQPGGTKLQYLKEARQLWPQLSEDDRQVWLKQERKDVFQYHAKVTASLAGSWSRSPTAPPPATAGFQTVLTHPGNSAVFLGSADGHIRVWDLEKPLKSYLLGENDNTGARGVQTTYDVDDDKGTQVVKESFGFNAIAGALTSASDRGSNSAFVRHNDSIGSLAMLTNPDFLISASRDGVIKVWR